MTARLGLIGVGRWGRRYVETIDRLPGMRLVRACTRHPETVRDLLRPVEVVEDWRQMCAATDLDGVIIATPAALHAAMLHACLDQEMPALIEKPVCLSLDEAEQLERRCPLRSLVLVDHTHLFHAAFETLCQAFPDPRAIRFVHAESEAYGPFRAGQAPLLWDRAPHAVAMCLELLSARPQRVACLAACDAASGAWDRHMLTLRLEFAGGGVGWIQVGHLNTQKRTRLSVFGRDRLLVFDDLAPQALVEYSNRYGDQFNDFTELGAPRAVTVSRELPLDRVLHEFVAGLSGRVTRRFGLALALDVTRVLHAAAASLADGARPVEVIAHGGH